MKKEKNFNKAWDAFRASQDFSSEVLDLADARAVWENIPQPASIRSAPGGYIVTGGYAPDWAWRDEVAERSRPKPFPPCCIMAHPDSAGSDSIIGIDYRA